MKKAQLCSECRKAIKAKEPKTEPTKPRQKKAYLLKDNEKVIKIFTSQKKAEDGNPNKAYKIEPVILE